MLTKIGQQMLTKIGQQMLKKVGQQMLTKIGQQLFHIIATDGRLAGANQQMFLTYTIAFCHAWTILLSALVDPFISLLMCFFLPTSRTATFRVDNNFRMSESLSSFALKVSFISNFPLPRYMYLASFQLSWIFFKIVIRAFTTGLTKEWLARSQFSITFR